MEMNSTTKQVTWVSRSLFLKRISKYRLFTLGFIAALIVQITLVEVLFG